MAIAKSIRSAAKKAAPPTPPTDLESTQLRVSAPKLITGRFEVRGIAPYVQHAFSAKQQRVMEETQRAGQQARGKKIREPKDFEQLFRDAQHISDEKWCGIPATAFRNSLIDACRLVGFVMTRAKLSVFCIGDGLDINDGTPLVRIYGEPEAFKQPVRNDNGSADIRWRPMWRTWTAFPRLEWDSAQFSLLDVTNLLIRAGKQVGIGEGRPSSPNSNGLGFGRFEVNLDKPVEILTS
jgi:hypothetical protein